MIQASSKRRLKNSNSDPESLSCGYVGTGKHATSRERTLFAAWIPRTAYGHGEVQDSIIEGTICARWRELFGELADPLNAARIATVLAPEHSPKPTIDVRIDDHSTMATMERHPCGARVRAESAYHAKPIKILWRRSVVVERQLRDRTNDLDSRMESKPKQSSLEFGLCGFGDVLRSWEYSANFIKRVDYLARLRALQQDLCDERKPRIIFEPPGV
jgi:hypothetical protein